MKGGGKSGEARREVKEVCRRVGMSRQNYYAVRRQRQRRGVDEDLVVGLVQRERRQQPRLGGRKLRHVLAQRMEEAGVRIGRDRFFEVLRRSGLLVAAKPRAKRTTQSRHSLPVYGNLLKGRELTGPNQAWVSDLTYVRTLEGFVFLAVMMDAWSRKLVGVHVGESLESVGCQAALREALAGLREGEHPIHHSDRGCQYCCHDYVDLLRKAGMAVSMTEELHCYENAQAERVIGILKGEYELDQTFATKEQVRRVVPEVVRTYNELRPHTALGYRVPSAVHAGGGGAAPAGLGSARFATLTIAPPRPAGAGSRRGASPKGTGSRG